MSGLRAQLSWFLRGRAQTTAALDSLSADLRALQAKVERLEQAVERRHIEEIAALRTSVAEVTDDLVERVNAVHDRVRALS